MTSVTLDNQLISLSQQAASTPAAQAKLASTIAAFMQANAAQLDGSAIATAASNLAYVNDQPALLAIVNNLLPGQASTLSGLTLDNAMIGLSQIPASTSSAQTTLATTIADFMQKVGPEVSGSAISSALSNLSYMGYGASVSAVVDNLVAGQAATLAGASLDQTLENLGGRYVPSSNSYTAPASASVIADFMKHVGAEVSGNAIAATLVTLSFNGYYTDVSAIVDNLVPGQATTLAGGTLDSTLLGLAGTYVPSSNSFTPPASATTLADFMQKVGVAVSGEAIDATINNLSYYAYYTDVSAIVDNLIPGQAATLAGTFLDQTLENLGGRYVPSSNTYTAPASASVIADFMKHVGVEVSGDAISSTLSALSSNGNYTDISAIVDNLVAGQALTLAGSTLDETLENLAGHYVPSSNSESAPASTSVIIDFMQKVGVAVSGDAISSTLSELSYGGYGADVSAIVDNLIPGQARTLAGPSLDQALENLGGRYVPSSNSYTGAVSTSVIADFMKHVGLEVSGSAISNTLSELSYQDDNAGVSAIVDNLVPGQATTLAGTALDQTMINLGGNPYTFSSQLPLPPASSSTIADFMQKVGVEVSGSAIGDAMEDLAQADDQTGVKAVVDNLATGQVTTIPTTYLDQTLINLSLVSTPTLSSEQTLASTLADYMQKAGAYGDSSAWSQAVANLEKVGDQVAANAIINNEPTWVVNRFSVTALTMDTHLAVLTQAMATAPSGTGAFSPVAVPTTTGDNMAVIAVHG